MSAVPEWNPDRSPLHSLVQLVDVVVVGFERYQEWAAQCDQYASTGLSDYFRNTDSVGKSVRYQQMFEASRRPQTQLVQIRDRLKRLSLHGHIVHDILVNAALIYVVRRGENPDRAEEAINRATNAIVQLCWSGLVGSPNRRNLPPNAFELYTQECERIGNARLSRSDLIRLLARIGDEVPPEMNKGQEFGEDLLVSLPRGLRGDPTNPSDELHQSANQAGRSNGDTPSPPVVLAGEQLGGVPVTGESDFRTPIPDAVPQESTAKESRKISKDEAEILVRNWLRDHRLEHPNRITIRRINADTGVSLGMFPKLDAWRDFEDKRKQRRGGEPRTTALSDEILSAKPDDREADPAEIAIRNEDDAAWEEFLQSLESSTERARFSRTPPEGRTTLIEAFRDMQAPDVDMPRANPRERSRRS